MRLAGSKYTESNQLSSIYQFMDPRPGLGRGGGLDRWCDRVCLLRYQTRIRGVSRALFLVATPHYFYYYNPLIM